MPTVKPLTIKQRAAFKTADFTRWVKDEMHNREINQDVLGCEIGLSQQQISYRIQHNSFSVEEMIFILDYLEASDQQILHFTSRRF